MMQRDKLGTNHMLLFHWWEILFTTLLTVYPLALLTLQVRIVLLNFRLQNGNDHFVSYVLPRNPSRGRRLRYSVLVEVRTVQDPLLLTLNFYRSYYWNICGKSPRRVLYSRVPRFHFRRIPILRNKWFDAWIEGGEINPHAYLLPGIHVARNIFHVYLCSTWVNLINYSFYCFLIY